MLELTEAEREILKDTWYADFETTPEVNFDKEGCVRVYMWGLMSADGEHYYQGDEIIYFLNTLMHETAPDEGDKKTVWFHNLKFDFSFIEDYFQNNNTAIYKIREDINPKNSFGREYFTTRDDAAIYNAQWLMGNDRLISFKDSAKVFASTVDNLGPSVGLKKLSEQYDYDKYVPKGYNPTDKEWEYMKYDIEIIRRTMNRQILDSGVEKLTRTSYAFHGLKETWLKEFNEKNPDWKAKDYGLKWNQTAFDLYFPPTDPQEYQLLSRAYNGGVNYVKPETRNKEVGKGVTLDVNSEYPAAMLMRDVPYGKGKYFKGNYHDVEESKRKEYPLFVQFFKCKFKLKDGGFPTLPKLWVNKGSVYSSEDVNYEKMKNFVLCSVDLKHFYKNYDVWDMEYLQGVAWKSVNAPFKKYIELESEKKIQSELIEDALGRQMSKLNMNGCYGKFGQKPNRGAMDTTTDGNGVVKFEARLLEPEAQQYFPMAIFVTAWARDTLFRGIYAAGVERVMYVDTDSIHISGWDIPEELEVHQTKLGWWKLEAYFTNAKYLKDKMYMEEIVKKDGTTELDIKAAGLNKEAKATITSFKDFVLGRPYVGVLTSRVVKGGTLLTKGYKYMTPLAVKNPDPDELERDNKWKSLTEIERTRMINKLTRQATKLKKVKKTS